MRFLLILSGLLMGTATLLLGQSAQPASYDVVIRNGRVLDGAGNPWILADVAITDGKFVEVGRVEGRGTVEIDATGRYVAPGFIDMMDQSMNLRLKIFF